MAASDDADFRPLEWLALFPAPSTPVPSFGDEERRASPDDASRAADPLTRDGMLEDLRGTSWLAAWVSLRLHCAFPGWTSAALFAFMGAISVVLLGLSLPLARASVAANDAAIGIAGVAVMFVVNVAVLGVSNKSLGSNLLGLLDFSSPAAVCRWLRLARMTPSEAVGKHGPPGALLDHMPGEDDCPCSSCSGWLQNAGGSLSLLNTFVGTIFFAWLMLVLVVYTPLVTYGAELWATPYGGLLGVLYALTLVAVAVPTWLSHPLGIGNVAYTTLELRLHCRAASLAMGDLLGRFRAAVADGSEPPRSPCWLYVRLHYRFTAMCRSRRHQDSAFIARLYGLVIVPCVVVFAVLNTAVGRCVPAWLLLYLLHAAIYFTVNAVNLAARNALIDSVTAVHRAAERDLRTLVLSVGPGPLADDAAMHCAALASFGEVQHHRAKLFGFVVSFGSVRTLLATGTTVAVALWTVLRAFGVSATLESFCFSGL